MKFSRYNVFSKKSFLAFNTLTMSLVKLEENAFNALKEENIKYINEQDSCLKEMLEENGFIVKDDYNELSVLKDRFWKERYDKNTLYLSILTTKKCNFRCSYCFEEHENAILNETNQKRIIDFIYKKMPEYENININWYGGEPLLNMKAIKNISDAVRIYCDKNQKGFSANITTNGYLLTQNRQEELKNLGVYSAQITIDGNEEIHNKRRPLVSNGSTYARILKNVKLAINNGFNISIRVNVDEENIDKMEGLISDIETINNENLGMHMCLVTPKENGVFNIQKEKRLTKQIINIYKLALQKGICITKLNILLQESCRFCVVDTDSQFVIDTDGHLYKCGETYDKKNDPGHIGYISNDGLAVIDEPSKLFWQKDPFETKCRNCNLLPLCMGGCALKQKVKQMPACVNELKYDIASMIELLYSLYNDKKLIE